MPNAPSSLSLTATCAGPTCRPCPGSGSRCASAWGTVVDVRAEEEWPLARTDLMTLHLADEGVLGRTPPAAGGGARFGLRDQAVSFTYRFDRNTEVTGPMVLRLRLSLEEADDAHLFVGVEQWSGGAYVPYEGSYGSRPRPDRRRPAAPRPPGPGGTGSVWHQPGPLLDVLRPVRPGKTVEAEIALSVLS